MTTTDSINSATSSDAAAESIAAKLYPDTSPNHTQPQPSPITTAHKQEVFRYLDLPVELQLSILELAVTQPQTININDSPGSAVPPVITNVSKPIRADALPLFYKMNHFTASYCAEVSEDEGPLLLAWLEAIGPKNRTLIARLHLNDCYAGEAEAEDYVDSCIAEFGKRAPRGARFDQISLHEYDLVFTERGE